MKSSCILALLGSVFTLAAQAQTNESLAALVQSINQHPAGARATSIVYIQCHGLGYGDLSCYGQTNYQTPNLDHLAAGGMQFMDFRPASTNFEDSLSALVYGQTTTPGQSGSVADRLVGRGYRTGLVGEWTLDAEPWKHGFQEFAGFLHPEEGRNYYSDFVWRFQPHVLTATNTVADWSGREVLYENTGGKHDLYLPELFASAMGNFVRIHAPDEFNKYSPFFLLVNLPAPRSADAHRDQFPVPSDAPFTGENWPQPARDRAALILRIDGLIGQLFDAFKKNHITNNVAVFFSSSAAPEPFHNPKMNFLNVNGPAKPDAAGIAPLPLIIWWPEMVGRSHRCVAACTSADFAPTALDIAGAQPARDLPGKSLVSALRNDPKLPESKDLPAVEKTPRNAP